MGLPPRSPTTALTIHNERIKLLATSINAVALAMLIGGFVAPATTGQLHGGWLVTLVWLGFGSGLHYAARSVLGRLR